MNIASNPSTIAGFDPAALHTTLKDIRQTGSESLTKALTLLSNIDASGVATTNKDGVIELAPPKSSLSAIDLTLRIGLLQDALNQLMQAVSKNEIEGRLNELNRENREQLDKMKDQMKHIEEEAAKKREADKKLNIFEAIANFFKAIFDIISAVFTAIAAVAYALTGNVVAAAGLFTATVALIASGIVNLTLAIDSVVRAATGGKSLLSDDTVKAMQKATEILGYVAMGAAMVGALGAVVQGIRQGANMAAGELIKHGLNSSPKAIMREVMGAGSDVMMELASQGSKSLGKELAKEFAEQAVKVSLKQGAAEGSKEAAAEAVKVAIREAVKDVMREQLKHIYNLAQRQGITSAIIGGSQQILQGTSTILVGDLRADAADAKRKADEAEAQAKAIEAMIQMLRKLIEQLEQDLQDMLESSMETISAIFNAADESSSSMKELMHFQSA